MHDRLAAPATAGVTLKDHAPRGRAETLSGTMGRAAIAVLAVTVSLCDAPAVRAADQTLPGVGNAASAAVAGASPLVRSAMRRLEQVLETVRDRDLREQSIDALFNPQTCVQHRSGLTAAKKQAILDALLSEGLYTVADAAAFPGGAAAGVFPPVRTGEEACPKLPQAFYAAPGSNFGSHHSYPGGLAIHEGFNVSSALSLAESYKLAYGTPGVDGLPRMAPLASHGAAQSDLEISQDEVVAAPLWHDWAKTLVFQWNADGTEFAEFNFGGNGLTDNFGAAGDSRTGGHHILSLAETIARGLAPGFVIAQASAHSAPTLGNEYKVVNWIRAAAIIAQADPVARGLLTRDKAGILRLPPRQNAPGQLDLNAVGQVNLSVEDTIHNLSDADFVFSIPAVTEAQVVLQALAPRYGYDPADAAHYTTKFRNPALSFLSAERVLILYTTQGLDAVRAELDILRDMHVI